MESPLLIFMYLIILGIVVGQVTSSCNIMGTYSGIICISATQYKVSLSSEVLTCPDGKVCVDAPEICLSDVLPACRFESCGICLEGATHTCMSRKTYAECVNGQPSTQIRNCQASRPYCSMIYDNDHYTSSCTNQIQDAACGDTTPTPSPPPPCPSDECIDYGKFPVLADPTCTKYYYCFHNNITNTIDREDYVCVPNTKYHPQKGKCVVSINFQCAFNETGCIV